VWFVDLARGCVNRLPLLDALSRGASGYGHPFAPGIAEGPATPVLLGDLAWKSAAKA
jgi:hypothetical protein